jgi:hypothetical protein
MDADSMKSPLMIVEEGATVAENGDSVSEKPAEAETITIAIPPSVNFADAPTEENEVTVLDRQSSQEPAIEDSLRDDSDRDHSYHGFAYRTKHGSNVTSLDDESFQLARLVRRDLPFSQSRNRVHVGHNHGFKIWRLLRYDWFHVILRYPPGISLLVLLSIWTCFVILFAYLYVEVDNRDPNVDCGLGIVGDPINFGQAFSFSLETTTTGKLNLELD